MTDLAAIEARDLHVFGPPGYAPESGITATQADADRHKLLAALRAAEARERALLAETKDNEMRWAVWWATRDREPFVWHRKALLASDAALAPTEPEAEREMAWLIERGQSMKQIPTCWYAEDEWTTDAWKARRFATREECEAFIGSRSGFAIPSHGDRFGVAVEHIFALAPTEPEAERGR